jgi:hypothetical protein
VHPLHPSLDPGAGLLPHDELAVERVSQRREGAVVGGGSQAAGEKEVGHLVVEQLAPDLVDDLLWPVADGRDSLHRKTQSPQALGKPVRVGVEGEPADQLVANRHDGGCCHAEKA